MKKKRFLGKNRQVMSGVLIVICLGVLASLIASLVLFIIAISHDYSYEAGIIWLALVFALVCLCMAFLAGYIILNSNLDITLSVRIKTRKKKKKKARAVPNWNGWLE